MFAVRQMIDHLPECIPVPPELRHRPTEVNFIAPVTGSAVRAQTEHMSAFLLDTSALLALRELDATSQPTPI